LKYLRLLLRVIFNKTYKKTKVNSVFLTIQSANSTSERDTYFGFLPKKLNKFSNVIIVHWTSGYKIKLRNTKKNAPIESFIGILNALLLFRSLFFIRLPFSKSFFKSPFDDCFFNNIEGQRGLENINRIYLFDEKKAKWTLLLSRNDGVTGDLVKKLDVMNLNNVIMSYFFVKKEGNPNTFIYQADLYNFSYIDYVKIDFNKATAQLTRVLKRDTSLKKVYDVVCRKI
jgi:hypothetical protein